MGNYEADVSVLTGQFLNYLNVCGQKLGYPFMLYSNGECGKKLVSSDGKHNAVAKVLHPFQLDCGIEMPLNSELPFGMAFDIPTDEDERKLCDIYNRILRKETLSEQQECLLCRFGTGDAISQYDYAGELCLSAFTELVKRDDFLLFNTAYLCNISLRGFWTEYQENSLYEIKEVYLARNASKDFVFNYLRTGSRMSFTPKFKEEVQKRTDLHSDEVNFYYDFDFGF